MTTLGRWHGMQPRGHGSDQPPLEDDLRTLTAREVEEFRRDDAIVARRQIRILIDRIDAGDVEASGPLPHPWR